MTILYALCLLLSSLFPVAARAAAIPPKSVPWNQLCEEFDGKTLVLRERDGSIVKGKCIFVHRKFVSVKTSAPRPLEIKRKDIAHLEAVWPRGLTAKLGHQVAYGLESGAGLIFSIWAPVGIVMVPATLVWGAVAAPVCLIRDIADRKEHQQEIRIQ